MNFRKISKRWIIVSELDADHVSTLYLKDNANSTLLSYSIIYEFANSSTSSQFRAHVAQSISESELLSSRMRFFRNPEQKNKNITNQILVITNTISFILHPKILVTGKQ